LRKFFQNACSQSTLCAYQLSKHIFFYAETSNHTSSVPDPRCTVHTAHVLCYAVDVHTFCAVFVHFIRIRAYEFISSDSRKGQTASVCKYNNSNNNNNNNNNNNTSRFVGKCKFYPLSNHQLLKIGSALWSSMFLCTVLTAPRVGMQENNVNELFLYNYHVLLSQHTNNGDGSSPLPSRLFSVVIIVAAFWQFLQVLSTWTRLQHSSSHKCVLFQARLTAQVHAESTKSQPDSKSKFLLAHFCMQLDCSTLRGYVTTTSTYPDEAAVNRWKLRVHS